MKRWGILEANGADKGAVFIYGEIVDERWGETDVTPQAVLDDLAAFGDVNEIDVRINSAGGSVWAGIAIYSALRRHPAKINVYIDSVAASIASVIAAAGDTVYIAEAGAIMLHNPRGIFGGDTNDLERHNRHLAAARSSMIAAYQRRVAMTDAELVAVMDAETWYTAQEAVDLGFADYVFQGQALAAMLDYSSFNNTPAALVAIAPTYVSRPETASTHSSITINPESIMTDVTAAISAATESAAAAVNVNEIEAKAEARGREREIERRNGVEALVARFTELDADYCSTLTNDPTVDVDEAGRRILAKLAEGARPVSQPTAVIEVGDTDDDKFQASAIDAIMGKASGHNPDPANPLRGAKITDIMIASLEHRGIAVANRYDPTAVIGQVVASGTLTTSDFPNILESAMHKMLLGGYKAAPNTWQRWTKRGSVSDFRAHNRYLMGGISNLDTYNEAGEFKTGTIGDGEKETQTAATKGKIIRVTREMLVNDDMQAFADMVTALGRAAMRSIETDAFTTLEANAAMSDTIALFHSSHANLGTAGAITPASLDEARQLLESQQDANGVDYLDLVPEILLVPTSAKSVALQAIASEADPTSGNGNSRKFNYVRDLVSRDNVVSSPRLTGNAWYLFANPMDAPVIEVAFLNGNDAPAIVSEDNFNSAGVNYRVTHDYGVAAIGYRGGVKNAGA